MTQMLFFLVSSTVIGTSFAFSKILKNETELFCGPRFKDLSPTSHIDFYVADKNSTDYLEDCLLRRRSIGRSVALLSRTDFYIDPDYSKRTVRSNFVIFISDLQSSLFDETIHRISNSQHQIKIHVISTTRNSNFSCNNGMFRKDTSKAIEDFLNILWHRYEMYYIFAEFPLVCPGYTVIFEGKKPSGLRLYDRTISTVPSNPPQALRALFLKDRKKLSISYPLRANIFLRFSTSITDCTDMHYYWTTKDESLTKGWCGMDVLVMHDILRYFQFKVDFPNVDNEEGYGYVNTNTGSVTGSLGYLLQDVIDISFNSRFVVRYLETDAVQFLHYVSTDSVCVVLRTPAEIPLWFYAFNTYKAPAWICLFLTFGIAGFAAKYILLLRKKALGEERRYTHSLIIVFIALGFTGSYLNKKVPPSILGALCLLISVTIMSYYQGYVNYMYTNRLRYPKLHKLAELRTHEIPIYTSSSMLDVLGKVDTTPFVIENVNKSNLDSYGNIGILQRQADMRLEISQSFSDEAGRPLYYILDECFSNYFLSYCARKDFPFASDLHGLMLHLLEAGLPDAYYRWTQNSLRLTTPPKKLENPGSELRPFIPSVLPEHIIPFGLLFCGYVVSTIILFVERCWASRAKKQVDESTLVND